MARLQQEIDELKRCCEKSDSRMKDQQIRLRRSESERSRLAESSQQRRIAEERREQRKRSIDEIVQRMLDQLTGN